MRKIFTQEQLDKKKKIKQGVVGIVLIGLMLVSTLAYAFFNTGDGGSGGVGEKVKYNGFEFVRAENGYWEFSSDGSTFFTYYNPKETESVNVTSYLSLEEIYNKPLYFIVSNPTATNEILQTIGRYSSRYQSVCLEKNGVKIGECNADNPIKTCSDNIIIFKEANETNVYRDGNCLFIDAIYSDQTIIADRIIFKTLGIQN
ncbi:MAG TPA: hypothetical protein VI815_02120 [Candidatus Nanoarchaeia archaeon]|nr:hypothetical protein [Candidatus Nanoarchaeia archaeon]